MRLLLTNDDGHDAPGLWALADAARPLGETVVVAPEGPCSSASHQVTTHRHLRLAERAADYYSVDGWPGDCVRVALRGLDLRPDWVLSGINAGGNLGADVYLSGTVAAAREAVLLGRPAVALSHYKKRSLDFDWPRAARWARAVLEDLFARGCPRGAFWNVNLPHLDPGAADPEVVHCPLDSQPLPVLFRRDGNDFHYAGDYHGRDRDPGADVDVCLSGRVAVTLIRLALLEQPGPP